MGGADGDTLFSSSYAAYESLSPGLRAFLQSTRAVHSGAFLLNPRYGAKNYEGKNNAGAAYRSEGGDGFDIPIEQLHPCVRKHPETGRPCLFVNGGFTKRFEGWTDEESAPLIQQLVQHAGREEHLYRHKWSAGDLVCWDNRCTMHKGPSPKQFPKDAVREFIRTTVTNRAEARPQRAEGGGGLGSRL